MNRRGHRSRGRPRTSDRLLVEHCAGVLSTESLLRTEPEATLESVTVTATFPNGLLRRFLVRITNTSMPTGGKRPWFVCPACGQRRARLYLPTGDERDYACRICVAAAYHIQYRKGFFHHMFRSYWKSARQAQVRRELEEAKRRTEALAARDPRIEALLGKTAPQELR